MSMLNLTKKNKPPTTNDTKMTHRLPRALGINCSRSANGMEDVSKFSLAFRFGDEDVMKNTPREGAWIPKG